MLWTPKTKPLGAEWTPAHRIADAGTLVADLATAAVPWLAATRDPRALPEAVSDGLLRPWAFAQDLLEYLVSQDQPGPAEALIGRYLSISAAHQESFAEGRRLARAGRRPDWHTTPAFGWSCEVLGLTGPRSGG
ncbi:hypothetical protein Aab01nite_52840 [Paractinoplanes abujensis]|uniref:Uncharacterized protein n=1 Tax=Paractinoplanes abujensis TaxID=882441 RepID=A0A7W7CUQ8_9ACTN|nr:hypothetical protein [Actinoplanes abujensis]MBB4693648.1 hypothetical protein [Actinoplanes abujensis]GID21694.1 hypothetical protein Aab01nite_52840 [Actinoplanes abujensis]